jgi:hypothetical protein
MRGRSLPPEASASLIAALVFMLPGNMAEGSETARMAEYLIGHGVNDEGSRMDVQTAINHPRRISTPAKPAKRDRWTDETGHHIELTIIRFPGDIINNESLLSTA